MSPRKKSKSSGNRSARLVPRRGQKTPRIIRLGYQHKVFGDLYVKLLSMPWAGLSAVIAALYLMSNLAFAFFYFETGGIDNADPHSFRDAYFFSVQTMATIGYGRMVPVSVVANIAVTVEALWGFSFFAVTTAIVFAKFSQPTARVLFSDVAVIGPHNGKRHLMFRLANQRDNRIVNAQIELSILQDEVTKEGRQMRQFRDLRLVRDHAPFIRLTWVVLHPIDEQSPLYGIDEKKLKELKAEIIVSLRGVDETLSQTIHARHSYLSDEIICDAVFVDVLNRIDAESVQVNYKAFHDVQLIDKT